MSVFYARLVPSGSPYTWDWTRMHALAVMHRRTLCENVDSAKIKVPFYTTDIYILHVISMHRIGIHRIDISIHIDESLHPYRLCIPHFIMVSLISLIIIIVALHKKMQVAITVVNNREIKYKVRLQKWFSQDQWGIFFSCLININDWRQWLLSMHGFNTPLFSFSTLYVHLRFKVGSRFKVSPIMSIIVCYLTVDIDIAILTRHRRYTIISS